MDRIPTKTKWEIHTFLHWAIPEKSKQQGGRGGYGISSRGIKEIACGISGVN